MQGNFRRWYVTLHKLCSPDFPLQPRLRLLQRDCQGQQPRRKQREGRGAMRPTFDLAGPKRSHTTPPKSLLLVNHTIFLRTTPPHWKRRRRALFSQLQMPPTACGYTNTSPGFHSVHTALHRKRQQTTGSGEVQPAHKTLSWISTWPWHPTTTDSTRKKRQPTRRHQHGKRHSPKHHQLGCSAPSFEARRSGISQPHLTSTCRLSL